jgi:hypothetical protein
MRCGLGTAANLLLFFQRMVRNTPQGYRRCFQQSSDSVDTSA